MTNVQWSDLYVGDVIMVKKDEPFPADLILLCSSSPEGNCYIMTSSLDGEKNLKPKYSIKEV
jgi:phospholipid-transporting ATPase